MMTGMGTPNSQSRVDLTVAPLANRARIAQRIVRLAVALPAPYRRRQVRWDAATRRALWRHRSRVDRSGALVLR